MLILSLVMEKARLENGVHGALRLLRTVGGDVGERSTKSQSTEFHFCASPSSSVQQKATLPRSAEDPLACLRIPGLRGIERFREVR